MFWVKVPGNNHPPQEPSLCPVRSSGSLWGTEHSRGSESGWERETPRGTGAFQLQGAQRAQPWVRREAPRPLGCKGSALHGSEPGAALAEAMWWLCVERPNVNARHWGLW